MKWLLSSLFILLSIHSNLVGQSHFFSANFYNQSKESIRINYASHGGKESEKLVSQSGAIKIEKFFEPVDNSFDQIVKVAFFDRKSKEIACLKIILYQQECGDKSSITLYEVVETSISDKWGQREVGYRYGKILHETLDDKNVSLNAEFQIFYDTKKEIPVSLNLIKVSEDRSAPSNSIMLSGKKDKDFLKE